MCKIAIAPRVLRANLGLSLQSARAVPHYDSSLNPEMASDLGLSFGPVRANRAFLRVSSPMPQNAFFGLANPSPEPSTCS